MRLLGIDAGGTSIRSVLIDDVTGERSVVDLALGGNVLLDADALAPILELVTQARPDRCGMSLAGAGGRDTAIRISAAVEAATGVKSVIVGDFIAAHWACFGDRPGIVLMAGTGSVCFGHNGTGGHALVGGHGPILGDEGSAWWIGKEAASAVLRAQDGRGPETSLTQLFDDGTGLHSLTRAGVTLVTDRRALALKAPLVDEAAQHDGVARDILERAAHELASLASAASQRLPGVPIRGFGGVFSSATIRARFREELPEADICGGSAAEAAAQLALRSP